MKPNALVVHKPENIKIENDKGLGQTITVKPEELINTAIYIRNIGYDWFMFATGVDMGEHIELLYRVSASEGGSGVNGSVIIKTQVSKVEPVVDSLVPIWPAANWHEREVFDLLGVKFMGHPNMRRIFMPDDWDGYPLRKDYDDPRMKRRPQYF
jgi:NADH-quinone oxidoreductase subunit C